MRTRSRGARRLADSSARSAWPSPCESRRSGAPACCLRAPVARSPASLWKLASRSAATCAAHRAAGLVAVLAVAEPAAARRARRCRRTRPGVARLVDPLRELAHAGRVDPQAAVGRDEQLAARRRVAAAVVVADRLGRLPAVAEQRVEQRRLADARAAEQHGGRARARRARARSARPAPVTIDSAITRRVAARPRAAPRRSGRRIGDEIDLRQHEHRRDAAVAQQAEVAIEPRGRQIAVRRRHHDPDVDVRGERLRRGRFAGRACARASSRRGSTWRITAAPAPRERLGPALDEHPVADRRQRALVGGA